MKILNIEKKSFDYQGRLITRAAISYGQDPLIGHFTVSENTQIYRYMNGYPCMVGRGFHELKVGMNVLPIFFIDKYNNNVLQSVVILEDVK